MIMNLSAPSTDDDRDVSTANAPSEVQLMRRGKWREGGREMKIRTSTSSLSCWKESVMMSWKNRRRGSSNSSVNNALDASDRTATTIEIDPDGSGSFQEGSPSGLETTTSPIVQSESSKSLHYKDLLLVPPKKISFVMWSSDKKKSKSLGRPMDADPDPKNSNSPIQNMNISSMSIGAVLGVDIVKNPKTKLFEIISHHYDNSEGSAGSSDNSNHAGKFKAPLLSTELGMMLLPGDVLESINGSPCRSSRDMDALQQRIVQQWQENDKLILTFICNPSTTEDGFTCHSDPLSLQLPRSSNHHHATQVEDVCVHQVTLITNHNHERSEVEEGSGNEEQEEKKLQDRDSSSLPRQHIQHNALALTTIRKTRPDDSVSTLHLDSLSSDSWLHDTCARSNDVVLAINTIPAYELRPDDANMVLQSMATTHSCVHLKFYSPPLSRRESIRRATVATAGGTLVGAGAIMMVTPLHPIGHAMTIGGLGVLGTEFEGPKRAFTKVGDAVRRRRSSQNRDQLHEPKEVQPTEEPQEVKRRIFS